MNVVNLLSQKKNEIFETHGEHNQDISERNLDARKFIRNITELSQKFTPIHVDASAVWSVANGMSTEFAFPTTHELVQTAARSRRQLKLIKPTVSIAQNLRFLKF